MERTLCPTVIFTILGPQNQETDEIYSIRKPRSNDDKAPKLWKDLSGGRSRFAPVMTASGKQ